MEEVKELTEFLERYRGCLVQEGRLLSNSLTFEKLGDIISRLRRGEKYEQMWEELDDFIGYSDYDILQKMEELKQKHFPKEVKS